MYHPIDVHVGKQVRFKRKILGLSQSDLAGKVGITFQQIQKYEKGENRVSASKLYEISTALRSPVSFFFDGYVPGESENQSAALQDSVNDKQTMNLIQAFATIKNPKLQKRVMMLVNSISEDSE
jgi:transcriptional regulator with XRE-family HTH domain